MTEQLSIPQAPKEMYKYMSTPEDTIMAEPTSSHKIRGYDFDKGVQVHVIGANFPQKGWPTPDAIWACNLVKKTVIETIKLLTLPQFWPSGGMFLLSPRHKFMNRTVDAFNRLSFGALSPYIRKDEYLSPLGRELREILSRFMLELGIEKHRADTFGELISTLIDYDTAYRYRLEDLMTETNGLRLWKRPIREVRRLARIVGKREPNPMVMSKFRQFSWLAQVALLSPKVRRAFKRAIGEAEFKNLQLDDADRYWVMQRADYLYLGMTYEERQGIMGLLGYVEPTSYLIKKQ